jgi:predicted N-acetyltransferase YhbS
MNQICYRPAVKSDAQAILDAIHEVAAEVPVRLDSPERIGAINLRIQMCCDLGDSIVAVDDRDRVVGFLLVEADQLERFHHNNGALHLSYGGVRKTCRGRGIFPAMVGEAMAKGVPLTATVKHANASSMTDRLLKLGFAKIGGTEDQDELRWQKI